MVRQRDPVWLRKEQVEKMLALAKSRNTRDYYLMLLLRYSLRVGEVVGEGRVPGIYGKDLRQGGVRIVRKGGRELFVPLPLAFSVDLSKWFKGAPDQLVFPITESRAEQIVKWYAREAGVEDWQRVGPHRLRAFYATDAKDRGVNPWDLKEQMRHSDIRTTQLYVGPPTPEQQRDYVESLPYT